MIAKISKVAILVVNEYLKLVKVAKRQVEMLSKDVEWSVVNGANECLCRAVKETNVVLVGSQVVLHKLLKWFPVGSYFVGFHNSNFCITANGLHMACGGFRSTSLSTETKAGCEAKTLLVAVHPP